MRKALSVEFLTGSLTIAAGLSLCPCVCVAQQPEGKRGLWTGVLVDQDCVTSIVSRESQGTGKAARRVTGEGGSAYSDKTNVPSVPNGSDAGTPADQTRNTTGRQGDANSSGHLTRLSSAVQRCKASGTTQSFALFTPDGLTLRLDNAGAMKAKALLNQPVSKSKAIRVRVKGSKKGDTIDAQSLTLSGR